MANPSLMRSNLVQAILADDLTAQVELIKALSASSDPLVEQALAAIPGLRFVESRRTLPFVDQVDGAFAAKFVRSA